MDYYLIILNKLSHFLLLSFKSIFVSLLPFFPSSTMLGTSIEGSRMEDRESVCVRERVLGGRGLRMGKRTREEETKMR